MNDSKDERFTPSVQSDNAADGQENTLQFEENPIPRWWKWCFIATIAFAPPYLFWHHCGVEGRSMVGRYEVALAANLQLQFGEMGELTADRENVVKYLYEPSWLKVGKAVFKANCVSCHGKDGGGLVGPNLCDDSYKNVKDIGDILKVLQKGANAGAMPAWEGRLSVNEIVLVSSYVASMRGSQPAIAKPAQGREIDPWPAAPIADEAESEQSEDQEMIEGSSS